MKAGVVRPDICWYDALNRRKRLRWTDVGILMGWREVDTIPPREIR